MRVVNRADFLKLPPGTIYAKGVQWAFEGIEIKGDSLENDWYTLDPAWVSGNDSEECVELLERALAEGISVPMEVAQGRDGYFDAGAVFLVFEREDLLILRSMIDAALKCWTKK